MGVTYEKDQVEVMCTASALDARDIGKTIRFRMWDAGREFEVIVTAELRQLSMTGTDVTIAYGVMAEKQVTLRHGHPVTLDPDEGAISDLVWLRTVPEEEY